jgi:alpha-L-fucosidase
MFSDAGPDIRWVGNEEGWARETNWCMLNKDSVAPGVVSDLEWLRSGHENGTHWLPAEVDVSIRPGWYYHSSEDHQVKTLPHLLDIYYHSVGRNASLLINFPVDTRGLIHEKDAEQILKLAEAIKSDFAVNLAEGKKVTSTNTRGNSKKFQAKNIIDNKPDTYWATDDSVIVSSITVDFGQPTEFNRFMAQEDIRFGQRVKEFTLEALVDNEWKQIASQTTIGNKRILRFPNVTASQLRLNVKDSKACPVISNIGVYKAQKVLVEPQIRRNKNGEVTITGFDSGLDIYYSIDSSEPSGQSLKYSKPFLLNEKATVKAIVVDPGSDMSSPVSIAKFDVSKSNWKLIGGFDQVEQSLFIFDGNPESAWSVNIKPPVDFIIDLGESLNIAGFTYLPDQGRWNPGIINRYEFYISNDGKSWGNPVSEGEFSNIKNSPVLQKKEIEVVNGRFVKFRALSPVDENGRIGIAEFDIVTQ